MRYRINLSVSPAEFQRIRRAAKFHGFRGPCEMVLAMVRLFLRLMDRNNDRPEPDEEYIYHLFDAMSNAEQQPDGTVPVTRWNKKNGQE